MDKSVLAQINTANDLGYATVALSGHVDRGPGYDITDAWRVNGYNGCGEGYLFVDAHGSPMAIEYADDTEHWGSDRIGRYIEMDNGGLLICVSFSCYTASWKAADFKPVSAG